MRHRKQERNNAKAANQHNQHRKHHRINPSVRFWRRTVWNSCSLIAIACYDFAWCGSSFIVHRSLKWTIENKNDDKLLPRRIHPRRRHRLNHHRRRRHDRFHHGRFPQRPIRRPRPRKKAAAHRFVPVHPPRTDTGGAVYFEMTTTRVTKAAST